uniref:RNA-directed DNA polymerase n=1 Tax=Glossina pallidipes TaxID=7398 RepID=A0A1B0A9H8_GLOPL
MVQSKQEISPNSEPTLWATGNRDLKLSNTCVVDPKKEHATDNIICTAVLKLNFEKGSFFGKEVKYLGDKVSTNEIHTDEDEIRVVREWLQPNNLHEDPNFLGLCTYYRRFVSRFVMVDSGLHDLTKKKRSFIQWKIQEHAFMQLKELLCTAPILAYPVPGEKVILDSDASPEILGSVPSQQIAGNEKMKP